MCTICLISRWLLASSLYPFAQDYAPYARQAFSALLDLFKERNRAAITQAHATLSELARHCIALSDVLNDIAAAAQSKVPSIRVETLRCVTNWIEQGRERACSVESLAPLAEILVKVIF